MKKQISKQEQRAIDKIKKQLLKCQKECSKMSERIDKLLNKDSYKEYELFKFADDGSLKLDNAISRISEIMDDDLWS